MAKEAGAQIVDLRFTDLPGQVQHLSLPIHELTEDKFAEGQPFDGSLGPRVPGDPGVGHAPGPRPGHRVHGPVHQARHAQHHVLREGPDHGRGLQPRPSQHRAEGRAVPEADRHRRRRRSGARRPSSTSSTRSATTRTSSRATTTSTRSRAPGTTGREKDGDTRTSATSRATRAATSPLPPMDKYQDLRTDMVLNLEKVGHHDRGPPPRGRHRGAGRDRHALRLAAHDRRQRHEVQVRRQEHGLPGRQDRHVHAQAAVHGQRVGDAHPPEPVDRRRAAVLGRGQLRRHQRPGAVVHRRAARSTRRRCSRSRTRRRTPTAGSSPATRRRSTSCTASGTGARASGSRWAAGRRRRSGSSSARPTRRATRTSRSARC